MNLAFKIWLKTQGIFLTMLYVIAISATIIGVLQNEFELEFYIMRLVLVPLVVIVVEGFFSIPSIFLIALIIELLKSTKATTEEKHVILIIGTVISFYICALLMILLLFQEEFLDIIQDTIFNLFTIGVLVASLISVVQHRRIITENNNTSIKETSTNNQY
ncbi:MAG: hypothetical protein R2800_01280 [Flavipsychrobacter sp.]